MELTKQSVLFLLNQNKKTMGLDADTLDGKDATLFLDKSETATLSGNLTLSGTATLSGATTISGATTLSAAVVNVTGIPTADPLVIGQLWNNVGALTVSAG